eukprot:CAMPEP_0114688638 /NCGR_PEP_ID=MMETSP0191-20121206/63690_1 /TAXON_ID=126664 /ORGANISM="Sorites sp." /LENGTH=50 /DNA_ID=CAMNT_0001976345 /DNA_START=392 /DNA_END=544 /DNA_ORIENTATION=+
MYLMEKNMDVEVDYGHMDMIFIVYLDHHILVHIMEDKKVVKVGGVVMVLN